MNTTSSKDFPKAKYYVLCNDRFMSGWGPAKDMINTIVLPCETWKEAQFVKAYAESRGDMTRIRICANKPKSRAGVLYSVHTSDEYDSWYTARFVITRKLAQNSAGSLFTIDVDRNTRNVALSGSFPSYKVAHKAMLSFWDVISACAAWAEAAGARHLEIEPA